MFLSALWNLLFIDMNCVQIFPCITTNATMIHLLKLCKINQNCDENVYKYASNVDIFSTSLTAPTAHASSV